MSTFNARQFVQEACMSDAHKDAYGFRPSQGTYAAWYEMSESELTIEMDRLYAAVERSINEDEIRHADAAVRFEKLVADTIALGANDRATAIKWIIDADGATQDVEWYGVSYLEYNHGLKFGYLAPFQP